MERYQDIKNQELKAKAQREKQQEEESRQRKIGHEQARNFTITLLDRIRARSILERYNREVFGSRGTIASLNSEDTLERYMDGIVRHPLERCLMLSFRHEESVATQTRQVPYLQEYSYGESETAHRQATRTEVVAWEMQPVHPHFATQVSISVRYEGGDAARLSLCDSSGSSFYKSVSFASPELSSGQNVYDAVIPRIGGMYSSLARELSSGYLSSGERIGGNLKFTVGPGTTFMNDTALIHDIVAAAFLANALNRTRQK